MSERSGWLSKLARARSNHFLAASGQDASSPPPSAAPHAMHKPASTTSQKGRFTSAGRGAPDRAVRSVASGTAMQGAVMHPLAGVERRGAKTGAERPPPGARVGGRLEMDPARGSAYHAHP